MNTMPFTLAMIIAGVFIFRLPVGLYLLLAAPPLLVATLIPIMFCLWRGLNPGQRIATFILNLIALGFYGYMTWGLFTLWRIGPLKH